MNHLKPLKNMSIPCITHVLAFACATLLTACTYSTGSFDEPGLRGKLIDAETSQPVQGAVIYGYYATAEGSLGGGETIKEILRVFEVESDANGVFEIPEWKTTWSITRGEPRQRFPAIAIYKDGYKLDLQNLSKIADWVSQTKLPGSGKRVGNVIDWTASPMQLKSTTTELERYNALKNSNYAYADVGECGWEQHVKLLVAQHVAKKAWVKRNIPPEYIDKDGYGKGSYFHPEPHYDYVNHTTVDKFLEAFERSAQSWKCRDPKGIFVGGKQ
jgi:hypothetical protein